MIKCAENSKRIMQRKVMECKNMNVLSKHPYLLSLQHKTWSKQKAHFYVTIPKCQHDWSRYLCTLYGTLSNKYPFKLFKNQTNEELHTCMIGLIRS